MKPRNHLGAVGTVKAQPHSVQEVHALVAPQVKVLGMVNADSSFTQQPEVVNGFSDLMVEVFGERGKHARAAVGMASLPRNIACEVEMIVEVQ